jgi:murein DD-endopeptidase MepM/ murein hydrolase activator NlpD
VWTYCHLAVLDASIQPGVALTAGEQVGLVGETGDATGPHLHLQLQPPTAWPQEEAWFQGFAGTAFSWQDDAPAEQPARTLAMVSPPASGPVFRVVSSPSNGVVRFTRSAP